MEIQTEQKQISAETTEGYILPAEVLAIVDKYEITDETKKQALLKYAEYTLKQYEAKPIYDDVIAADEAARTLDQLAHNDTQLFQAMLMVEKVGLDHLDDLSGETRAA